jgi:hypothetical protein
MEWHVREEPQLGAQLTEDKPNRYHCHICKNTHLAYSDFVRPSGNYEHIIEVNKLCNFCCVKNYRKKKANKKKQLASLTSFLKSEWKRRHPGFENPNPYFERLSAPKGERCSQCKWIIYDMGKHRRRGCEMRLTCNGCLVTLPLTEYLEHDCDFVRCASCLRPHHIIIIIIIIIIIWSI